MGWRTFLINMYRSSGISGARPTGGKIHSVSQETVQRRITFFGVWVCCWKGICSCPFHDDDFVFMLGRPYRWT